MPVLLESSSPAETRTAAARLAQEVKPGDVIALDGELGAGKTVFAKGFAEGLGFAYPDEVTSPTFTLMQVYEGGRMPLYHFDAYRLEDASEAIEIGIEDYLFGQGVCLIEWASVIEELLPAERTTVTLRRVPERGSDYRQIRVERFGEET